MNKVLGKDKFLQLIQENKKIIFKICNSYCHNKNNREDLAQEIIYHLWKAGDSFNSSHKFSTWMYRVALNVAISFYRKEKKDHATISLTEDITDNRDNEETSNEADVNKKLLQQFINDLKELDRALMILYLEAKSYGEIAYILGISETNAATKVNRIKDKLKQRFLNYKK